MTDPTRWHDLSPNPNDPSVIAWRQHTLDATRHEPVPNRTWYLKALAEGHDVLDIGVVEHEVSAAQSARWLHRHLAEAARRCVGVDILADEVHKLREHGYDIRVVDVIESPLDEQFDVIIAGEIIEHVGAPQALFESVASMLTDDGVFALTTPNPYMAHRVWRYLRGDFPDSVDHTTMLTASNLVELASRAGLDLVAWRGIRLKDRAGVRNRLTSAMRRAMIAAGFAEEIACDSIIYEFRRAPATTGS